MSVIHQGIIEKMLKGLEQDKTCVEDPDTGKQYFTYNEIEIDVGGYKTILKKDGQPITKITASHAIKPGDTITLNGVLGFVEFTIE